MYSTSYVISRTLLTESLAHEKESRSTQEGHNVCCFSIHMGQVPILTQAGPIVIVFPLFAEFDSAVWKYNSIVANKI